MSHFCIYGFKTTVMEEMDNMENEKDPNLWTKS